MGQPAKHATEPGAAYVDTQHVPETRVMSKQAGETWGRVEVQDRVGQRLYWALEGLASCPPELPWIYRRE